MHIKVDRVIATYYIFINIEYVLEKTLLT